MASTSRARINPSRIHLRSRGPSARCSRALTSASSTLSSRLKRTYLVTGLVFVVIPLILPGGEPLHRDGSAPLAQFCGRLGSPQVPRSPVRDQAVLVGASRRRSLASQLLEGEVHHGSNP